MHVDDPDQFKVVASELAARSAREGGSTIVFVPGKLDTKHFLVGLRGLAQRTGRSGRVRQGTCFRRVFPEGS